MDEVELDFVARRDDQVKGHFVLPLRLVWVTGEKTQLQEDTIGDPASAA